MPVDRMQWGAEAWQYADLHMPDEPSPFQNDHGVPCIMLIHGGFWKKEYSLELMQPIANALSDAGVAAWNIEFKRWDDGDERRMDGHHIGCPKSMGPTRSSPRN